MKRAADVVITGHTHEAITPGGDGQRPLFVNPGECGGWLDGKATCVVLDLESLEAELCEIGGP